MYFKLSSPSRNEHKISLDANLTYVVNRASVCENKRKVKVNFIIVSFEK
jgi:hypothetical protein